MTLNYFLQAIANKLKELYPNKTTYLGEIPRDADGNFYVRLIDSSQEKHLDRRRKRVLQFEVLYFCSDRDTESFLDWSEVMYDNFERLTVETGEGVRSIALKTQKAHDNNNTMMYQFLFDAEFYFVLKADELPTMETLEVAERMKA